ncbi:hypothetical protein OC844_005274 [Tilletia horrida]|nr:hypothetical protein OC844_005274 [Tilletia horrida]
MAVIQGATAPQGWSVPATVVLKSAITSLKLWKVRQQQNSGADRAATRRDAINKVRRYDGLLSETGEILQPGQLQGESSWSVRDGAYSAEILEEIPHVREAIQLWPDSWPARSSSNHRSRTSTQSTAAIASSPSQSQKSAAPPSTTPATQPARQQARTTPLPPSASASQPAALSTSATAIASERQSPPLLRCIHGATSPTGWHLPGVLVIKASIESARLWGMLLPDQQKGMDRAAIRKKAIMKVLVAAGVLDEEGEKTKFAQNYAPGSPYKVSSLCDPGADAEVPLVQLMIQNWTTPPLGQQPAQTIVARGPGSESSATQDQPQPPPRRPASPLQEEQPAKRARTNALQADGALKIVLRKPGSSAGRAPEAPAVDVAATTLASDATAVSTAPAATTASTAVTVPTGATTAVNTPSSSDRFFSKPKLLTLVASHLRYEKADLITLSQVSKRVRACTLPLLVESVNVRLTRIGQLNIYLQRNAGISEHIKYLRIFDDVAHHHAHYLDSSLHPDLLKSLRNQDDPKHGKDVWSNLSHLLMTIQGSKQIATPLLALSFGQYHLVELYNAVRKATRVLERLVSLQIVSDFAVSRYKRIDRSAAEMMFRQHGTALSEDLENLLLVICDAQDEAGTTTFRTLAIDAFWIEDLHRGPVFPTFRLRLLKRMANRLRDLDIGIVCSTSDDIAALCALLKVNWPKLASFGLRLNDIPGADDYRQLRDAVSDFLKRHNQLQGTAISIDAEEAPHIHYPHWCDAALPQLRSCSLSMSAVDYDYLVSFATEHEALRELTTRSSGIAAPFAYHPSIATSLRKLRAGPEFGSEIVKTGVPLQHLALIVDEHYGPWAECWAQSGPSAKSMTCLEYAKMGCAFRDVLQEDSDLFTALKHLPELVELSLSFDYGENLGARDGPAQSAASLAELLIKLCEHGKNLRAVRIDYQAAADLPADAELVDIIGAIPPRLEYITWHVHYHDRTDHYRVLRPSSPNAGSAGSGVRENAPHPLIAAPGAALSDAAKPRLQCLPATFRPFVDRQTGLWEDLSRPSSHTLFDHLGDQPRLKYL